MAEAKKGTWDALVPVGIIGIILMMILPLPPALLDTLIALSMALSIGVFLTALFIEQALEFSAFPAFVLVATLLRLSLNVATTRLILLHGGEGQGSAGSVVEAFGRFVVEGNVLVGLIVFLILTVINFVVVTKGAGRVAEVAARFTLDAMPGKQMAIDADLSAGAITQDQARTRRRELEREADFFGAMDGSSKFVHGDAIAGLLIMAINLIGGIVLGISRGMDIGRAAETLVVLSVGDALASQVPSLLISAASGIVVTRTATGDQLGRALASQFFGRRTAVTITAAILTVLALMPGMPAIPCLALAGAIIAISRRMGGKAEPGAKVVSTGAPGEAPAKPSANEAVDAALALDVLSIELGYELVPAVDAARGGTLTDRVAKLREELARELGIVVPPVHVSDNLELGPSNYRVMISGVEVAKGTCAHGRVLAIDGTGSAPPIEGEPTTDPTFGMPAIWIAAREKELAEALGYTVVDHATIIATHLGEVLRNNAHRLLGRQEVQHLLDVLAKNAPKLVDDVVPALLPLGDVARILRNLVREGISVRDMRSVLEAIAEVAGQTKDAEQLTELVRERLAPAITARYKSSDGTVAALTLDPRVEQMLRASLHEIANGTGGALDPDVLRNLTAKAEASLASFTARSASPLIVTAPDLRRYVRAIVERKVPQLAVASFREIEPAIPLRIVDRLSAA
ncbi:Flagellar biosynthesis protein FlhA [Labilithrix luteola]|uniref:Flagellar biosynthesis protein FlhA n=1 Tax=Labilithrix luteola TaxID=1391654 RepID=A0A0K1PMI7_9BACT|nr:flagellar biosynthesis protein FlhA [Labilithrix luteola]AKU94722.1 Flagellar biosynthesis protein FlhA [Labilithrix luteola]